MPNYTRNNLKIYGPAPLLQYFYEKNRVTEEDVEFMEEVYGPYTCDLSFEKSVPRHNYQITTGYIQELIEKIVKGAKITKPEIRYDASDYYVYIWGTKSEAIDPTAYLEHIERGEDDRLGIPTPGYLLYTFNTAWSYPVHWLLAVARLYPKLRFELTCTNEDDNYEMEHIITYEGGELKGETSRSHYLRLIEERGGMEEVTRDLIKMMEMKPLEIDYKRLIEASIAYHQKEQKFDIENYYTEVMFKAFSDLLYDEGELKGQAFEMMVSEYFGDTVQVAYENQFAKFFIEYVKSH